MKSKPWVIGVVVVLLGTAALITYKHMVIRLGQSILPGMGKAHTDSMEDVTLTLTNAGGTMRRQLRVPQAYLTDPATWRGGEHEVIRLEFSLNGLPANVAVRSSDVGRSADNAADVNDSDVDRIDVWLLAQIGDATGYNSRLWEQLESREHAPGVFLRRDEISQFGLVRLFEYRCPGGIPRPVADSDLDKCEKRSSVVYASPMDSDVPISGNCPLVDTPGVRCTFRTVHDRVQIMYSFPKAAIPQWRAVDDTVRRVLGKYVMS